ncbi:MAG: alkaline phosphatase family protein [Firmicutes bacterium]|nr:phosphoesterase [Alicyclobacillaceae bacterium]MCL6496602.1 alkaline phosphatase family protein [Bacillota bacterium]
MAVVIWILYLAPIGVPPRPMPVRASLSPFSHVFVIMMENQGPGVLNSPDAPFLRQLARRWAVDTAYYGVTHPSLPNYVALITGRTLGSHSDDPRQRFPLPTLVQAMEARGLTWQAVMESLPDVGYRGNWYPNGPSAIQMPARALYAKKHDPFLLIPALAQDPRQRQHVVPLSVLRRELVSGHVPNLVFLVPNLCHDMHGQPNAAGAACPAADRTALLAEGDRFLAQWIPRILHSPAWRGNAVIFVTWDEGEWPGGWPWPWRVRQWIAAGPEAPAVWGWPGFGRIGGGQVPLVIVAREGPHPLRLNLWADHYSLLKTLEAAWHLPELGHTASPQVPLLTPFLVPPR